MEFRAECLVVGAGVIGLAVARQLAIAGLEVLVVEKEPVFGSATSSRNSEVIHAGIYYPPGSLKAALSIRGRKALYRYLEERAVPHRRTGKLIVATSESQLPALRAIEDRAIKCGVHDLSFIDRKEALDLEPNLECVAALHSPSTGIVDSHALMQSYIADVEAAGGIIAFNTEVVSGVVEADEVHLQMRDRGSGSEFDIRTNLLVNSAGLDAQRLVRSIAGFPAASIPEIFFAKGNYFSVSQRKVFSRLIYPVPVEGGLGVHLTMDLDGNMRFGPDVEWADRVDYSVDALRSAAFYDEIRRYWPALQEGSLAPAYCGIRPKLSGPGQPAADFRIDGPQQHGIKSIVNLFGIESPGLTSSLALAEHVSSLVL